MPSKQITVVLELPEEIHALVEECAISLMAEEFDRFIQEEEQKKDIGTQLKWAIQALDRDGF